MRLNIYIPTRELHESIKDQAGREGRSVSEYLLTIHKEHLGCLGNNKWSEKVVKAKDYNDKVEIPVTRTDFFNPHSKSKQLGNK